ncbi:MAG: hypothetical protein ACI8QS_002106 [Planctomycetota bacterium]|jgi:hypothetical protein
MSCGRESGENRKAWEVRFLRRIAQGADLSRMRLLAAFVHWAPHFSIRTSTTRGQYSERAPSSVNRSPKRKLFVA